MQSKEERSQIIIGRCPKSGKDYRGVPATSREDPELLICPDCGTREALLGIGVPEDEVEEIIRIVHEHTRNDEGS